MRGAAGLAACAAAAVAFAGGAATAALLAAGVADGGGFRGRAVTVGVGASAGGGLAGALKPNHRAAAAAVPTAMRMKTQRMASMVVQLAKLKRTTATVSANR